MDTWIECVKYHKLSRKARLSQPARRSALFGLLLDISLTLPSVGFSLPIGSDTIGAEFGLSFSATAEIYFSYVQLLVNGWLFV